MCMCLTDVQQCALLTHSMEKQQPLDFFQAENIMHSTVDLLQKSDALKEDRYSSLLKSLEYVANTNKIKSSKTHKELESSFLKDFPGLDKLYLVQFINLEIVHKSELKKLFPELAKQFSDLELEQLAKLLKQHLL